MLGGSAHLCNDRMSGPDRARNFRTQEAEAEACGPTVRGRERVSKATQVGFPESQYMALGAPMDLCVRHDRICLALSVW
jgi:hypothetical protein